MLFAAAFFVLLLSFADLGSFASLAGFGVDVPFAAFGVLFNLIRGFFGAVSGCCWVIVLVLIIV